MNITSLRLHVLICAFMSCDKTVQATTTVYVKLLDHTEILSLLCDLHCAYIGGREPMATLCYVMSPFTNISLLCTSPTPLHFWRTRYAYFLQPGMQPPTTLKYCVALLHVYVMKENV